MPSTISAEFCIARKGNFVVLAEPYDSPRERPGLPDVVCLMRVQRANRDGRIKTLVTPGEYGASSAGKGQPLAWRDTWVLGPAHTKALEAFARRHAAAREGAALADSPRWSTSEDAHADLKAILAGEEPTRLLAPATPTERV